MMLLLTSLVFFTLLGSLLFGLILLSVEAYADGLKISKGKIGFNQSVKMIIKESIQSNLNKTNEISINDFVVKFCSLIFSTYLVTIIFIETSSVAYCFLALSFIFLTYTYVNGSYFQKNYLVESNFKNYISQLSIFVLNFTLSFVLLTNIKSSVFMLTIFKIVTFINFSLLLYQVENVGKYGRNIQNRLFSKVLFVFTYFSLFLYINSFSQKEISPLKVFYYLMSIFLVEFIASYIKKNINSPKFEKLIKYNIEGKISYFAGVYIIMLGVYYAF